MMARAPQGGAPPGAPPAQGPRAGGGGVAAPPIGGGGDLQTRARQAAQQQEVQTAGQRQAATSRARVENEPPGEARQAQLNSVKGLARSVGRLEENFEPEFVGKFAKNAAKLRKEFEQAEAAVGWGSGKTVKAGAFFGTLREFSGSISTKEATFRRDVADIFDQMIRLRSGAAVGGEREYDNIKNALFDLWKEPNVFLARLAAVKADLAGVEADLYTTSTKGAAQGAREAEARRGQANPVRQPAPTKMNATEAAAKRFWDDYYAKRGANIKQTDVQRMAPAAP